MKKTHTVFDWLVRIVAAVIMLQTLYFKFSGAPESVYIFSSLAMEPWGRYATGVLELIASVLLIIPSTALYGALLGAGIISGAIVSHLTILGIEINNDGGYLFILALIVLACCAAASIIRREEVERLVERLFKGKSIQGS